MKYNNKKKILELHYSDINTIDFIETLAGFFKTKSQNHFINIPEQFGSGYAFALNVAEGISVLIYDASFNTEIHTERKPHANHQYFTLQFNDAVANDAVNHKHPEGLEDVLFLGQSLVYLASSYNSVKCFIPANTRTRSIKIIFTKEHLLDFLDIVTVENFLTTNFSLYFKKNYAEPVDADYRLLMTELIKENIEHPLRNIFIHNRVLLLLEGFLQSFIRKHPFNKKALQLKDEVILRLVKAEALLVKNFAEPPPTIDKLAKASAMSSTKFKHDFKSLYGLPLYEYYQKNRMMYARTLILEGTYVIKEVGNMVGYSNLGHFAASFKKEFGILPSELMSATRVTNFVPSDVQGN